MRIAPLCRSLAATWSIIVVAPATADLLVFDGFADTSLLQLNGATSAVATADGVVLRVVPALPNQSGSAFSLATVNAATFSTHFRFRLSDPDGSIFDCNTETGADGLVFVIQSVSSGVGGGGQGMGYEGIPKSVGVEFDTWCNGVNNDPSSNHVGIDVAGAVDHGPGAPNTANIDPRFDDGSLWYAWIDYDGTTLRAYLSQGPVQPFQPVLTREVDVPALLEQPTGYIGFTAGTGGDWGNHDVVYWEYTPYAPVCIGDFDGSGEVNAFDLGVLLGNWGSDLDLFDLNGDHVVDGQDVGVFLGNWGPCAG